MRLLILFLLFLSSYSLFAQELCLVSDNQQLQELFRAVNNTVGEVQENLDVDALISIVYDPEQPLAERNAQVERLNLLPESVRPLSFAEAARELCGDLEYQTRRNFIETDLQILREIGEMLAPEHREMSAVELTNFRRENPDIYPNISVDRHNRYVLALESGYELFNPLPTIDELTTIKMYTNSCYGGINRVLREANPFNLYRFVNLFSSLNNLISQLPVHRSGRLRRATTLPEAVLEEHTIGSIVRYAAVTSTTSSRDVDLERFGCHQFILEGGNPRILHHLSVNPGEREVIYPPGQCFLVTRRSRSRSVQRQNCRGNAYKIRLRAVSCTSRSARERR